MLTQERRKRFEQIQKEEMSKPKDHRVPHFIDRNGELKPYTKEQIAASRVGHGFVRPDQDLEVKSKKEWDRELDPEIQRQLLEMDKSGDGVALEMQPRAKPLLNYLNLKPEQAVPDVTIEEVVYLMKQLGAMPIEDKVHSNQAGSPFYDKVRAQMDEKELAQFNFREQQSFGRSIQDFVENHEQPSVYEQYKSKESVLEEDLIEKLRKEQMLNSIPLNEPQTPTLQSYFEAGKKHSYDQFEE